MDDYGVNQALEGSPIYCEGNSDRASLSAMQAADGPWLSERLKHSLQLLASPAEIQLSKFPPFVHAPDEMALDFQNFHAAFVGSFRAEMTDAQLRCLESIDKSLGAMRKDCFSSDGVTESREWRQIRRLAAQALQEFGWPLDDPPRRDHEFVPGSG
jgi:hypothetical protein